MYNTYFECYNITAYFYFTIIDLIMKTVASVVTNKQTKINMPFERLMISKCSIWFLIFLTTQLEGNEKKKAMLVLEELIDFNGISTRPCLSYAETLVNNFAFTFNIFIFFSKPFLKIFFFPHVPIKYDQSIKISIRNLHPQWVKVDLKLITKKG